MKNRKGYFITGTDTDVGKTFVAGKIAKYFREQGVYVGYFKAALSGMEWNDGKWILGDAKYVCEQADIEIDPKEFVVYSYKEAVSPHLAARRKGEQIELEPIRELFEKTEEEYELVIAEGSGGILCPLCLEEGKELMLEDVIRMTKLPVIVVADAGLGTINHTLLTVKYLEEKGFEIAAIILNRYEEGNFMHQDNKEVLEKLTGREVYMVVDSRVISTE